MGRGQDPNDITWSIYWSQGKPKADFCLFLKKIFFYFGILPLCLKKKKKQKTPLRKEYLLNSHNSFIQLALEEFQAVAKTQDDTQVQS